MVSSSRPRTPSAGKGNSSSAAAQLPTSTSSVLTSPANTAANAAAPAVPSIPDQHQQARLNNVLTKSQKSNQQVPSGAARRSSLGLLLRRSKSNDLGSRKRREADKENSVSPTPPVLPQLPQLPIDHPTMIASSYQPRSSMDPSRASGVPVPPMPGARNSDWIDPYARTESMTHRGRYSYASSAVSTLNNPRRVRRRKDPTPFNILIIGASSSGKTSFLNFLKTSLALPPKKRPIRPSELVEDIFAPQGSKNGNFEPHYLESEIDGERVGVTLWDSEGLEKNVVDLQLREMSSFLESKFEETFTEEMKVVRAPGVQDTHIHCAFLILDPLRIDQNLAAGKANKTTSGISAKFSTSSPPRVVGGLDEDLDLQVLRTLQGKTTVIPIISKADTITTAHMTYLKKTVWDSLRKANLDPLESLGLDEVEPDSPDRIDEGDEEDYAVHSPDVATPSRKRLSIGNAISGGKNSSVENMDMPYLPLSIISPDIYEPGVIGRKFPWGFADPLNAEHCDFVRLKEAVFSEWRGELREASRELWYEGWRTSRLKQRESRGIRSFHGGK